MNAENNRPMIIGAGPAGLTAALVLAEHGIATTLVGPPAAANDTRTTALLSGTVALLERVGAWEDARQSAGALRVMRILDGTRRLWRAPPVSFESREIGLDAFGWNIGNSDLTRALEATLRHKAQVIRIESSATVEAIDQDSATVRLDDGRLLKTSLVIAADGRGSKAREAAGIGAREWSYPQAALTLCFRHSRPHNDISTEFHTETGPFTLVPLPGNRSGLVCVVRREEGERLKALDDAELSREIERRSHSILGKIEVEQARALWPLSGLNAQTFAANRVALIGESGHVFPPIGAQGFNLTARDIVALAETIVGATDPGDPARLKAYDGRRRNDIGTRTMAVDIVNRSLLTDFLPVQGARGLGLFALDRIGPLRRAVMREGLAARA